MNRVTLENAIELGLRRAAARRSPIAATVADCIELALELERAVPKLPARPTRIDGGSLERDQVAGLPPNPGALLTEIEDIEAVPDPGTFPPAPDPDHSPEPSIVVLGSESEMNAAITNHREGGKLRIKNMFLGNKGKVSLQGLAEWVRATLPNIISVQPRDVDHEIELHLQVLQMPNSADNRASTVKVAYENPRVQGLHAGVVINLPDVQEEFPDPNKLLAKIKEQAVELFRSRPKQIVGRIENVPELRGQFAAALSAHSGRRPKGMELTIVDDDDESRMRK
jgi:hypothetical protein